MVAIRSAVSHRLIDTVLTHLPLIPIGAPRLVRSQRESGLDLVRGVAAFSVVVFHLTYAATLLDKSIPFFKSGALGVDVFFVLSGYVILITAERTVDRRSFVLARWMRLYPAFVICVCLTTLWVISQGITAYVVSPLDWLANLTMVPAWFGAAEVDGVYWSLGYEIAFYAVVGTLMPIIKRGYALHLCVAYLMLAASSVLPSTIAHLSTLFIMGIALSEIRRSGIFAVAVLLAAIVVGNHFGDSLIAPISVVVALGTRVPEAVASWCGTLSHPLYLLHNHIGCSLIFLFAGLFGVTGALTAASLTSVVLAAAVNRFLEKPIVAFLKALQLWQEEYGTNPHQIPG